MCAGSIAHCGISNRGRALTEAPVAKNWINFSSTWNSPKTYEVLDNLKVKIASEAPVSWDGNQTTLYESYKLRINSNFHAYSTSEQFTGSIKRAYPFDDETGKMNLKLVGQSF